MSYALENDRNFRMFGKTFSFRMKQNTNKHTQINGIAQCLLADMLAGMRLSNAGINHKVNAVFDHIIWTQ